MKIKKQFTILSFLIISIPILCAFFILLHTYIHSPNRYLMKGTNYLRSNYNDSISQIDLENLEKSIKLLPQDVEAALIRISNREVLYSTMKELKAGNLMNKGEIWAFAEKSSDTYFYQFTQSPSAENDILIVTRLPHQKLSKEEQTRTYLKILLIVIIITIICLFFIALTSKEIFQGFNSIEKLSSQLAEGKLDTPILKKNDTKDLNEFTTIMQSLEKMRCELLEMQVSKNRFITGISHDLRTPVAVIRGYSEAIKDEVITDKDEVKNTVELIEQKTIQLEGMIDTLLNFMKLNNYEIKEKLSPHSITTLITEFAKYAEVTGKIFKRNVYTDLQFEKDIKVPLNELLILRSFENLLSNAIRYTKENDDIRLKAITEKINSKKFIILQFIDSGFGIEKKDLDYIFDIFYRGTNSRQEEGMGIGLAVVKSIMDTHGWEISVESQKNRGTTFTIKIPYK